MAAHISRRTLISGAAPAFAAGALGARSAPAGKPGDYIIVEGHRDIWEISDRTRIRRDAKQRSPISNFLLPRLLEAGLSVVIMPAGGDSVGERDGRDTLLEGSMRVLDMLLCGIEECGDQASIIKTRADIPSKANIGKVQFFLDIEGGASLQAAEPEPEFVAERSLALLRQFFRLGCRGLQLTHNGRNQLGDGRGIDKMGSKLTPFGVEVVKEMNRLGMMVGVSHLCANAVFHCAEISKTPIVSTHQNLEHFVKSRPLVEIMDEEAKAIAQTGGIVGIRYIEDRTPYRMLVDEIEYLVKLVGVEHIGIGWLGHDKGHPATGQVPGYTTRQFSGVETQSMLQHWTTFIGLLRERGFNDQQIGLMLGGNYLRIWRRILPAA